MKYLIRFLSLLLILALLLPLAACAGPAVPADTTAAGEETAAPGEDPAPVFRTLSVETYRDKTRAGFLSQLIGFLTGFEFSVDSSGEPRIAMPDSWFQI
ncbi:MAG: hypothetical protein II192_08775, partial [Clostridia bacterium]|nr:hypothetical protein [Clostridia bacterium]